ncbi:MAG: ECF transporter S component [Chloroflexi bacterium]|nr:MAG: ECF transporter S component [Chloroflexota bacterium]
MNRAATAAIYLLTSIIGIATFVGLFVLPQSNLPVENSGLIMTMLMLGLALVVLLVEVQGQVVSAKIVSALGILIAITSVLRFIEVAIPGPGGFSPIFAPIILGGYVFGARFGFLLGTLTLLVSGLITGGVGPWLPYQMFTAGWVGLSSGWLPHPSKPQGEVILLLGWGFIWGMLYGLILNLYFWPLMAGTTATSWEQGIGLGETVARYGAFYIATSLLWDMGRSIGNVILLLILGTPTIRALSRFRNRLQYEVITAP